MGFATGQKLRFGGRYRLVEALGSGGMGTVWQAFDERLYRPVAVKILDPSRSQVDQVRVEALALAQLSHPHIANVFDYGEESGRPYLVMELVRGRSLAAVLARGPMDWRAAVAAAAHVASALAAAHERGVVHRDVKPGNIMVTPTGSKLIDFGISAVEGEAEVDASGRLRGTPAYVAPERLHGRTVAAPSDVYGLGIVLYRALSARLPWPGRDTEEYLTEREHSDPGPLPPTEGLPVEIVDLCMRCLAADPEDRPDAKTLAQVFTEAAGAEGVGELAQLAASPDRAGEATRPMTPPSTRDRQHRRPSATARFGAAAAAVAAALALAWSTTHWSPSDDAIPGSVDAPAGSLPACDVTFQLAIDDGQRFAADIVATPRRESFQPGWRLSLPAWAGIDVDHASGWTRAGAMLTSPAQPTLDVGGSGRLALSGSHSGAIALPDQMTVDGQPCAVTFVASNTATPTTTSGTDQASTQAPAQAPSGPASSAATQTPPERPDGANNGAGRGPGNNRGHNRDDG